MTARFRDIIRDNERLKAENADLLDENVRVNELLVSGRGRIDGLLKDNQELQERLRAVLVAIELRKAYPVLAAAPREMTL
jgi:hypothetical protein